MHSLTGRGSPYFSIETKAKEIDDTVNEKENRHWLSQHQTHSQSTSNINVTESLLLLDELLEVTVTQMAFTAKEKVSCN